MRYAADWLKLADALGVLIRVIGNGHRIPALPTKLVTMQSSNLDSG